MLGLAERRVSGKIICTQYSESEDLLNTFSMPTAEATLIGTSCFSYYADDKWVVYFSNLEPFDSPDVSNRRGMLCSRRKYLQYFSMEENS